jgi:hypothetical protein
MRVPPIPELLAPAPVLATALLALNDHWLKYRFPGPVTGKLSDFAGAFVTPLFVSALLAMVTPWPLRCRLWFGVVATVSLLVAVKLSAEGAEAVGRVLGVIRSPLGHVRTLIVPDASDLIAKPLALLAFVYGQRAGKRGSR